MFTEVHSAFSEFLYMFRSFILNVYTDLDFFIIICFVLFFTLVNGKDVVTLVCFSYVALRSQHAEPKREDPAVWNGF